MSPNEFIDVDLIEARRGLMTINKKVFKNTAFIKSLLEREVIKKRDVVGRYAIDNTTLWESVVLRKRMANLESVVEFDRILREIVADRNKTPSWRLYELYYDKDPRTYFLIQLKPGGERPVSLLKITEHVRNGQLMGMLEGSSYDAFGNEQIVFTSNRSLYNEEECRFWMIYQAEGDVLSAPVQGFTEIRRVGESNSDDWLSEENHYWDQDRKNVKFYVFNPKLLSIKKVVRDNSGSDIFDLWGAKLAIVLQKNPVWENLIGQAEKERVAAEVFS